MSATQVPERGNLGWELQQLPLFANNIILPFTAQGVSLWRVKSCGVRQSKIYKSLLGSKGLKNAVFWQEPCIIRPCPDCPFTDKKCEWNDISLTIPEIGVRIRLLNEETKKYCVKGERDILSKYEDIRSDSTLQLRDQLHKVRWSNGPLVSIDTIKRT